MRKPSPQLLALLADCLPGVTQLTLALRDLILSEVPNAEEVLYSVYAEVIVFRLPERKGGAFCYAAAYSKHVNLGFYKGADLQDPHGLLAGTGKKMRHIRIDSLDDLHKQSLRKLIRASLELIGDAEAVPKKKAARRA